MMADNMSSQTLRTLPSPTLRIGFFSEITQITALQGLYPRRMLANTNNFGLHFGTIQAGGHCHLCLQ
jgi:hypothetical protein